MHGRRDWPGRISEQGERGGDAWWMHGRRDWPGRLSEQGERDRAGGGRWVGGDDHGWMRERRQGLQCKWYCSESLFPHFHPPSSSVVQPPPPPPSHRVGAPAAALLVPLQPKEGEALQRAQLLLGSVTARFPDVADGLKLRGSGPMGAPTPGDVTQLVTQLRAAAIKVRGGSGPMHGGDHTR